MTKSIAEQQITKVNIFDSSLFRAGYQDMVARKNRVAKTKKILLIEDDADMSDIIQHRIKKTYHCVVDVASDPFEAMNMMVESYYDLIVLDWNLPVLDGGETLLRTELAMAIDPFLPVQWDHNEVPVVVFSSWAKENCRLKKTKHFNCVGFVSKAQPLNKIISLLADFVKLRPITGYAAS